MGQVAKEVGTTINGYLRFGLGEGAAKGEGPDFASEAAAAAGLSLGIFGRASSPAQRGRGTTRSVVEGAAAAPIDIV